jgi:ribosome-binding protein aMBF1 (putative translation factor)
MPRKKIDPEQEVKDWYYSWWLWNATLKLIKRDGAWVLKGMREKNGMTQREIADALGLDFTYISKVENGKAPLSVEMVKKLRKFIEERDGE